jgi:hypothetical protein
MKGCRSAHKAKQFSGVLSEALFNASEILFPNGQHELDILRFAHRIPQGAGELAWFVEVWFI